jgi:hypothetical protein
MRAADRRVALERTIVTKMPTSDENVKDHSLNCGCGSISSDASGRPSWPRSDRLLRVRRNAPQGRPTRRP